jgi:hypothetical protein
VREEECCRGAQGGKGQGEASRAVVPGTAARGALWMLRHGGHAAPLRGWDGGRAVLLAAGQGCTVGSPLTRHARRGSGTTRPASADARGAEQRREERERERKWSAMFDHVFL